MFTTRNVVLGVIATFVVSLAWMCWTVFQPLDSGGLGNDTYGIRRHGVRAWFEVLTELGIPVERGLAPPSPESNRVATFVFWKPSDALIGQEPAYLHAVSDWMRAGGRVVVSPAEKTDPDHVIFDSRTSELPPETLLVALRGPSVDTKQIDLNHTSPEKDSDESENAEQPRKFKNLRDRAERSAPSSPADWDEDLKKLRGVLAGEKNWQKSRSVSVQCVGSLAHLAMSVKSLELPEEELPVLKVGTSKPSGRVVFIDPAGNERTLIATYAIGKGELVVVAAPMIAENRLLAQQDNSVLVTELVAGAGGPIVFDEFYHGLTVRGNPLWLFTRRGFSLVTLCLLGVASLVIWRSAVFLGPPLAETIPSRRSIGEYVVAMASFLNRGRNTRKFVLEEVRSGVLHAVRNELGLPPGREQVEELAGVLRRRDPQRAARLVDAVSQIDQALSTSVASTEKDAIRLLQGISSCL